jgi:hypothetical protein
MDGAYFRRAIIELLERHGAECAIKVPFYPWVGLKRRVEETKKWTRAEEAVSCAEHDVEVAQRVGASGSSSTDGGSRTRRRRTFSSTFSIRATVTSSTRPW